MQVMLCSLLFIAAVFFVEFKCSELPLEKVPLVRGQNILNSMVHVPSGPSPVEAAWMKFNSGDNPFELLKIINSASFDPNAQFLEHANVLTFAIMHRNRYLLRKVLRIPSIDVNCAPAGFRPIELCFDDRELFDLMLAKANELDLLSLNAFGTNPIYQAIREGRFDLAFAMFQRAQKNCKEEELPVLQEIKLKLEEHFGFKIGVECDFNI
jgi:hypothetical protein